MNMLAKLEFPPIGELLEWKDFLFKDTAFGINKIAVLSIASMMLTLIFFFVAGSKRALVPRGVQNLAESVVQFVREGIIDQTLGQDGMKYLTFLTSMFCFIFFCNIFEVIPGIQFPATARMAIPIFMALLVWVIYNVMGIKEQGALQYFKSQVIPPGVPKALLPLVALIEFVSNFIVRPFSLAVRLFANELAGHLLLVTFATLSAALWTAKPVAVILPLPAIMLVLLTGFEVLVAVLQAFIFTILTAVYIGAATHPDH